MRARVPAVMTLLTFYPGGGRNLIATDGIIVVDSVSDIEVSLGLVAAFDDNAINGRLTNSICAE
jgi:hypothetical protein